MLGFVAAVLFSIAFLIYATSTSTSTVLSPTSFLLAGAGLPSLCTSQASAQAGQYRADGRAGERQHQPLPDRSHRESRTPDSQTGGPQAN